MVGSGERIQKILAQHGIGSRRQIEKWIKERVVTVNGSIAKLGCKVTSKDQIKIKGQLISLDSKKPKIRVLLYNKPIGEICTKSDVAGRPMVFDKLPKLKRQKWVSVGRMDINTSGLLLFTNNGDLANKLMHPSSNIERRYAVRVFGKVTFTIIKNLQKGVKLEDGFARFAKIQAMGGEGINKWYQVVLNEGRNRIVRRLWEAQGIQVNRLIRIKFGSISLPRDLKTGCFIELNESNIKLLQS